MGLNPLALLNTERLTINDAPVTAKTSFDMLHLGLIELHPTKGWVIFPRISHESPICCTLPAGRAESTLSSGNKNLYPQRLYS